MALVGILTDAQPDVEAVGVIAGLDEHVPHGQGVLAATDRDEDPIVGLQHVEVVDRLDHLATAQLLQVLGTEVGVVPR